MCLDVKGGSFKYPQHIFVKKKDIFYYGPLLRVFLLYLYLKSLCGSENFPSVGRLFHLCPILSCLIKNSSLFWTPNHSYEISDSVLVRLTISCTATVTSSVDFL